MWDRKATAFLTGPVKPGWMTTVLSWACWPRRSFGRRMAGHFIWLLGMGCLRQARWIFFLKLFVYFVSFYPKLLHFFFAYGWNLNTHMIWRLWHLWPSGGAEPMTGNSPCFWRHGSRQRNCHAWLQKGRHLNDMWCGGSSWTDRMCGRKW